jgi:hypothetical protein
MFYFAPKKKPNGGFTHWDIHALARCLDPEAWAEFDKLPDHDPITGDCKYYGSFEPVTASFDMAARGLKNGVKIVSKDNLWSSAELFRHLLDMKIQQLEAQKRRSY